MMSTIPEALRDLASRIEAGAHGSDVDREILSVFGFTWRGMAYWANSPDRIWPRPICTHFTSKLDAALALMPVGWVIERLSDTAMGPPGHLTADGCKVEIVNDAHTGPCVASGNACTRPAALCAAILRAHADTVSNSGERPW